MSAGAKTWWLWLLQCGARAPWGEAALALPRIEAAPPTA